MKKNGRHIVDLLFVLALFGVFALSALTLANVGANVYRKTVTAMEQNVNERTPVSYLTEKVRRSDSLTSVGTAAVTVATLGDIPALVLTEETEDASYNTYLYCLDGKLKELSVRSDMPDVSGMLAAGQDILDLEEMIPESAAPNLIKIHLTTADGETRTLLLSLHCTSNN